ncbi:tyrosine-type recombinase/integrase [Mycobacterium avium]|uniref:tyrosine-type recombinase/integrase n=1 Tax=Mycobacterium avium TaxID=1764 RepID=UPI000A7FACD6|nr:site-specific integrase [Mycobacterium avium]
MADRRTGKSVVRYQVTVDAGKAADGRRRQVRRRYRTENEAREGLAKITGGVVEGSFVARSALTVEQACRDWLAGMHDIEPTTRAAYTHALKPLRERHGDMAVQQLTKSHLDQLVTDLTTGKLDGQKRAWTANSINPMLNLVSRVLADLVRQGALARDVAAFVKRLKRPESKLTTFTEEEVRQLLKHVENDRLGHAWHLALAGLRRGEICGLEWADVQLDDDRDAGTLTVAHNRVSVGGRVHEKAPKTVRSARTLPLTPTLARMLKRAKALQAAERLRLGPHYLGDGVRVVVDDSGRPYHPDTLSDFWRELCGDAKVRRIRLHDARHSCASLMHAQGVPIAVISAWLGHADPAFTMRTYVHAENDALNLAAASLQKVVTPS